MNLLGSKLLHVSGDTCLHVGKGMIAAYCSQCAEVGLGITLVFSDQGEREGDVVNQTTAHRLVNGQRCLVLA